MESRIREGRNKLIDAFVHLVRHENNDPVVWCYPPDGLDEELRRSVPSFAFPFREGFQSSNIDYFTFVLTALDGKFRFGFCRMAGGSESTLCLISSYPWFEIFYKILDHLSDAKNSSSGRLQSLLEDLSEIDPSIPGKKSLTYKIPGSQLNYTFEYPNPNKLPSIPESRNLTEYYNAIDGYAMIIIFASMLFERRIIVTSRKLSRLTSCVYGATSLIYPLNWQHIFIPVLPAHLLDYLSAPMPYLIGVHSSLLDTARSAELDDAVIVDADKNEVRGVYNDLASLPSSVVSALKKSLNLHRKGDKHCCLTGDKLSTAFLNAMVALIGGYRTALVERDGRVFFDRELFEQSRGSGTLAFLQKLLQSQSFERFVEERVTFAKYRKGFSDIFEKAVEASEEKHKGNVKHKVSHLKGVKADKMLVNFTKQVKKTSGTVFSSVKKRLDSKKNHDNYEEGKAFQYQEEVNQASAPGPTLLVVQPSENAIDNQITLVVSTAGNHLGTPPILRRQRSSPKSSTINRRHSFIMSKADGEIEFRMQFDINNVSGNCSVNDLTNKDAEDDVITLSSRSLESFHDAENSKTLPVSTGEQNQAATNLPSVHMEAIPAEADTGVAAEPRLAVPGPCEPNPVEDLDEGHSEDDVVGEINTKAHTRRVNRLNKDPVVEFPSVRRLASALQPKSTVRRKAIISVQELPNVRQIIQKIEASSKPSEINQQALTRSQEPPLATPHRPQEAVLTTPRRPQEVVVTTPYKPQEVVLTIPLRSQEVVPDTLCKSPEVVVTTPFGSQEEERTARTDADDTPVVRQSAMHSLQDRKNRTSLTRKQAIRVSGPRMKKPSLSDVTDGCDADPTQKNENRASYMRQNFESYQGSLDLAKTERSSVFLEVNNPYEDDYGCLLRVSTKSASMRQLNLIEQRHSASLKRSLPVSVAARDNAQRSRTAIYGPQGSADATEATKPVMRNNSKRSSCRNALYVKSETVEVVDSNDSDDSASEIVTDDDRVEHPNEFARRLNYETVSNDSSPPTEPEPTSQNPEFRRKSFRQSLSFDGVIVDKRDVLEMFLSPDNEQDFPGRLPVAVPNRGTVGSSDEESSSDGFTVFDDLDLCEPSNWFCTSKQDGQTVVSVESDA